MYEFGPIGTLVRSDAPPFVRCQVSITGREHPELVPESFVWTSYFHFVSGLAPRMLAGGAEYAQKNVIALQKRNLPMPVRDIQFLITVAVATTSAVEAAQRQDVDDARIRQEVVDIVCNARSQLIRGLSKTSWVVVKHDADTVRDTTVYNFPVF